MDTHLDSAIGSEHSSPIGKHTLGARKTASKGAKKGKLGAQKVEANFDDLEKQADEAEKRRIEAIASRPQWSEVASNATDSQK